MRGLRTPFGLGDDPARQSHRLLMAFLTDREFPGGKTREVPRVALVATQSGWKATLTDYTLSMAYTVEFRHISQLLDALSTGFTDPDARWVPVKVGDGYKARKEEERKMLETRPDEVYHAAKGGRKEP